jgi:hypothetical protein
LILLVAFGLRLFHLGHQELRGDEAFDALFSAQPVAVILSQLQGEQPYPPLFHTGLHYWLDLLGQSEVAQRLPALISGVLLLPLIYQLARLMLIETTALLAAALAAINPFYVWHAQDGRMYSLLAALSVASIWLALRWLQDDRNWKLGAAYWAVTILALFTHYFAWWVLLAENIAATLIIWQQDQRPIRLGRWLVWQAAIVLPQLPWLASAAGLLSSHTSGWIQPIPPLEMLRRALTSFSLGATLQPVAALVGSLLMGILFALGCFFRAGNPRFKGNGRLLLLVFVATPLLATVLLSMRRPAFDEKYLIAIVAPFLILVAHGLASVLKRSSGVALVIGVLILLASGWSLFNYYFGPEYAKSPRWRDLVASIETRAADGDIIVYNYPDPGLQVYYRGDLPLRLLPASPSSTKERTGRALQELAAAHSRVWLVPTRPSGWDPEGWVESWLMRHADLVDEQSIDELNLQLYHTPSTFLREMQPVAIKLEDQVELLGYRLTPGADQQASPGDRLLLTLYWQALRPIEADYKVFVHLSDPREEIWGQDDSQPVNGTFPTTAWSSGQIVVDRHMVEIDPAAPPGSYRLMTGMYDSATAQRLTIPEPSDAVMDNRIVLAVLELANSTRREPDGGVNDP